MKAKFLVVIFTVLLFSCSETCDCSFNECPNGNGNANYSISGIWQRASTSGRLRFWEFNHKKPSLQHDFGENGQENTTEIFWYFYNMNTALCIIVGNYDICDIFIWRSSDVFNFGGDNFYRVESLPDFSTNNEEGDYL